MPPRRTEQRIARCAAHAVGAVLVAQARARRASRASGTCRVRARRPRGARASRPRRPRAGAQAARTCAASSRAHDDDAVVVGDDDVAGSDVGPGAHDRRLHVARRLLDGPLGADGLGPHRESHGRQLGDVAHARVDHETAHAVRRRGSSRAVRRSTRRRTDWWASRRGGRPGRACSTATWIDQLSPGRHLAGERGARRRARGGRSGAGGPRTARCGPGPRGSWRRRSRPSSSTTARSVRGVLRTTTAMRSLPDPVRTIRSSRTRVCVRV